MWEPRVQSLGWEDPLEKEMAMRSSTLAWKIPWRSLIDYSPWGRKESDTTEQLHFRFHFIPFMGISVMINTGPRDQNSPQPF